MRVDTATATKELTESRDVAAFDAFEFEPGEAVLAA